MSPTWCLRVGRYSRAHVADLTGILALLGCGVLFEALKPWPLKIAVDYVLAGQPLPARAAWIGSLPGAGGNTGLLAWVTIGTVIIFLSAWAARMGQAYLQAGMGARMMYRLGGDLFDHVQRLSLRFHARSRTGDQVQRITSDCACARDLITGIAVPLFTSFGTLAVMFAIMWRMDPALSLTALVVAPLLAGSIWFFARPMQDRSYEQSHLQGQLMAAAEQTLTSLPVVKAFGREQDEDRRFSEISGQTGRASLKSTVSQLQFRMSTTAITAVGTALVMSIGGFHALEGRLSVGDLLVFLSYLASLYQPLETMAYLSSGFASAAAGARRVFEVLDIRASR